MTTALSSLRQISGPSFLHMRTWDDISWEEKNPLKDAHSNNSVLGRGKDLKVEVNEHCIFN